MFVLSALWDPVHRWSALAVRPETWISLIWLLLLKEIYQIRKDSDHFGSRQRWLLAFYLALAAYFHFAAIIFVPGTMCSLLPLHATGFKAFKIWTQLHTLNRTRNRDNQSQKPGVFPSLQLTAAITFWSSMYLCYSKPET